MSGSYKQRVANYAAKHGLSDAAARKAIYANRIAHAAASGKTTAQARGHTHAPEHGGILKGVARSVQLPGHTVKSTYSDSTAERYINKAAEHDARVMLRVHTADGGWQQLGLAGRGYSASYLAQMIADAGDLRTAVSNGFIAGGDAYDLPEDGAAIDAWQVDEIG